MIVNSEYFKNVFAYTLAMHTAKAMLESGIISAKDYVKIDKMITEKYNVNSCSIFREKP